MQIKETNIAEIAEFEQKQWEQEDEKHYGKHVPWDNWEPQWQCYKAEEHDEIIGSIITY